MSKLSSNTSSLQSILNTVNNLPNAGGSAELPTLSNPGSAEDLLLGKQLINQNGKAVTGTFTIDAELNTQDDLIAQITAALIGKAGGSDGGGASYSITFPSDFDANSLTMTNRYFYYETPNSNSKICNITGIPFGELSGGKTLKIGRFFITPQEEFFSTFSGTLISQPFSGVEFYIISGDTVLTMASNAPD